MCGEVDCTALGKSILVGFFSMCMFAHYWSWLTMCDKMPGNGDKNYYDLSMSADCTEDSVQVESYLAVWACTFVASGVGLLCLLFGSAKFGKMYAMVLLAAWLWISIQDYAVLGKMVSYWDRISDPLSGDAEEAFTAHRNAWGFFITGVWFGETFILFNTAWDAANRDDVERKGGVD